MCLSTINKNFSGRGKRVYSGWKIFEWDDISKKPLFVYQYIEGTVSRIVPTDKWIHVTRSLTLQAAAAHQSYQVGFHVYTKQPNHLLPLGVAEFMQKVKYKGILAKGMQGRLPTVVVKSIYVTKRRIRK